MNIPKSCVILSLIQVASKHDGCLARRGVERMPKGCEETDVDRSRATATYHDMSIQTVETFERFQYEV